MFEPNKTRYQSAEQMNRTTKAALILIAICFAMPIAQAKKNAFTGSWLSKQYTNGKEFQLKIQQNNDELLGWEGIIPQNLENVPPDFTGTIKGKEADIEVQHRRGYKAHAHLRLQGDKLVWQLFDSDSRSNRYFPLASTLSKRDDDTEAATGQSAMPTTEKNPDQFLYDILANCDSFDSGTIGEGAGMPASFSAYKAIVSHNPASDTPALQALSKSSKPAARVYAAAICWEINHEAGLQAFKALENDSTPVAFKSGCEVLNVTVQEIARSYLQKGSYLDFPAKKY